MPELASAMKVYSYRGTQSDDTSRFTTLTFA